MTEDNPVTTRIWVFGAAIAGAISAQPVMKWKEMSWAERLLTVFVGSAFAVFLTPFAISHIFRITSVDLQTLCAITYAAGTVGNAVVPILINRGKDLAEKWGSRSADPEIKP